MENKCAVTECIRTVRCKSFCSIHYRRWKKYNDPLAGRTSDLGITAEQMFERNTTINQDTGCWEWRETYRGGYRPKSEGRRISGVENGYGIILDNKKKKPAHRWSYERFIGPIPLGMRVLHKCDNPPCVNPDHLFLGTQADNIADSVAKGRNRGAPGERNIKAKLTFHEVEQIRSLASGKFGEKAELGRRFGVTTATICKIIQGLTWK